jgi:hypothetical protein
METAVPLRCFAGELRVGPMFVSDKFSKAFPKLYPIYICHHFLFFLASPIPRISNLERSNPIREVIRDAASGGPGDFLT